MCYQTIHNINWTQKVKSLQKPLEVAYICWSDRNIIKVELLVRISTFIALWDKNSIKSFYYLYGVLC